jgi:hypothetical protein
MNWFEQVGRGLQIGDCELKKEILARNSRLLQRADLDVIRCALRDSVVEDRRVGGKSCDRQLVDVSLQRSRGQQLAGDIVEPQALTEVVQLPGRFHVRTPRSVSRKGCALEKIAMTPQLYHAPGSGFGSRHGPSAPMSAWASTGKICLYARSPVAPKKTSV